MIYTPGEVSTMLNIPASTLRRYVATFGDLLSKDAKMQRGRRFTAADVSVIAQVRDLAQQGVKLESIAEHIESRIEPDADQPSEEEVQTTALAVANRIAEEVKTVKTQIGDIAIHMADQDGQISELRSVLERQNELINKLNADIESERQRSIWDILFGRNKQE